MLLLGTIGGGEQVEVTLKQDRPNMGDPSDSGTL